MLLVGIMYGTYGSSKTVVITRMNRLFSYSEISLFISIFHIFMCQCILVHG